MSVRKNQKILYSDDEYTSEEEEDEKKAENVASGAQANQKENLSEQEQENDDEMLSEQSMSDDQTCTVSKFPKFQYDFKNRGKRMQRSLVSDIIGNEKNIEILMNIVNNERQVCLYVYYLFLLFLLLLLLLSCVWLVVD